MDPQRRQRPDSSAAESARGRPLWRRLVPALVMMAMSLGCIAGLTTLRVTDPLMVRNARETSFDLLQRATPRDFRDAPVRIIDIDERSLAGFGQWPWPRDMLGEMVDRLHAAGATTVAFDVIFAEPDRISPSNVAADPRLREALGAEGRPLPEDLPDNDLIFAEAMKRG